MGINFGIRCDDLLQLKFGHIINIDKTVKSEFILVEQKNNNHRVCYMNDFVVEVAKLYTDSIYATGYQINLNDYLFTSLSNSNSDNYYNTLHCKSSTTTGKPLEVKRDPSSSIQVKSVEKMLKRVSNKELGRDVHIGIHLMRKTFAYHFITNLPYKDWGDAIKFIKLVLGFKSSEYAICYAGILGYNGKINEIKCKIDFNNPVGLIV